MLEVVSIILKRKKYAVIALLAFLVMIGISYYLTVINVSHKSLYFYAEMNGYIYTIITMFLAVIISVLLGLYASLLIFKVNLKSNLSSGDKKIGTIGTGIGIIASGCPSCGVPLLGLVGLPFGLASLPFRGIELKIMSIIFLLISIHYISRSIKGVLNCNLISLKNIKNNEK